MSDIRCTYCGEEFDFALGHRCRVMSGTAAPREPYHVCGNCGADLSKHPVSASAHQRAPAEPAPAGSERLFDLVEETRKQLQPYLRIETFTTGSKPMSDLAVDVILQAAFER